MAHKVKLTIAHELDIQNVDVEFNVSVDGQAFGRLRISKGSVDWVPRNMQKSGYRMTWQEFSASMKGTGKRIP